MHLGALLAARLLVVLALFPALAGCATQMEGEPLDRADLPPAPPAPRAWTSRDDAAIRPGALIETEARACPVSFVFVRPDNGAVFVGTTAYCVRELGVGAIGTIGGPQNIALLVYHSMQTMAERGEEDPHALEYNDLAVFHVDRAAARHASPALPEGGPERLRDGAAPTLGERLRLYSPVVGETPWRDAIVTGSAGEWALIVHAAPPAVPGELGGAVLDADGEAVGILVSLGVVPNPGANAVARLDTILAYAREHAALPIDLATPSQG